MHNLSTLLKRLEAATLRLEDIASSTIQLPTGNIPALQQTLASADQSPAGSFSTPTPARAPTPIPEWTEDFDAFIDDSFSKWVKISNEIGGPVAEQAALAAQAFKEQRKFLLLTTKTKKPDLLGGADISSFDEMVAPVVNILREMEQIKSANDRTPLVNHLKAVVDGAPGLFSWLTMDTRPHKTVEEFLGSSKYWSNRVLTEYKQDQKHVTWVNALNQVFGDYIEFIKTNFPNGLVWNPKGMPVKEAAESLKKAPAASSGPPAGGAPPPPPPPGPPPVLQINEVKAEAPAAAGGLDAVFGELNKGEAVTAGLRKVDKSQMTHKNPSLRASSTVSGTGAARGKSPAPARKPEPESMRVKKPPRKELEGNKWTIENFENTDEPIEIEASISHSILISKCNKATVVVKGKANAVTIENTNRFNLVVDTLVSSIDVVKSNNFALQVMGTVPSVLMDQIDGAQVYFSKESIATKIIASKSANINLNVMAGEDGDYKEVPLPSQICSYYDEERGDLVNEIVSHAG